MKKLFTFLTISALALSVSMAASATPKPSASDTPAPAATPSPTPEKAHPFPFHGEVAAADSTAKTFTVKSKDGRERVFHVGDNAKPTTKDGWSGDFGSITVGAYATGTCTKTGNQKFEIISLHIGTKPVKKTTPTPKPTATPKPSATPKPN